MKYRMKVLPGQTGSATKNNIDERKSGDLFPLFFFYLNKNTIE
ncbi:hypothetical protein J2S21_003641 [Peribacillus cavernae]|nr:hypothetical protein [Peribacillus cavernae]